MQNQSKTKSNYFLIKHQQNGDNTRNETSFYYRIDEGS